MWRRRVLAFYYVWYGTPWGPFGAWRHWGVGDRPEKIIPPGIRDIEATHYPLDGVYDSGDEYVIRRHLMQAQRFSIDGFIVSWWGLKDYSHLVLEKILRLAPKDFITIYYETAMTHGLRERNREKAIEKIYLDLLALAEKAVDEKAWMRVNGKPVFFIYIAESYKVDEWRQVRDKLEAAGHELFLVGDTFKREYLDVFDGLHTYNPIWITLRGRSFHEVYSKVAGEVKERGGLFAATVIPGCDDRKIRSPGVYIPREDGRYYVDGWRAAVESGADWVLITTWNEWHEGTEIEPSIEYGFDYLYLTAEMAKVFKR